MRHQATKSESQVEAEEAERLVRPAPKYRPPRHDLRRENMREKDPDVSGKDPDMSLNFKNVGGSVVTSPSVMASKSAVYHGVLIQETSPYPGVESMKASELNVYARSALIQEALNWLPKLAVNEEAALREALDYAIYTSPFQGSVGATSYNLLLEDLKSLQSRPTLKGILPMKTVTASQVKLASQVLETLDKMAQYVQTNYTKLGMSFEDAKRTVNALDRTADTFEVATLGKESFVARQAEVLERDPQEPYVETFEAPQRVHQSDADEPYMALFNDDQTSGVGNGKTEQGKPIAPSYA